MKLSLGRTGFRAALLASFVATAIAAPAGAQEARNLDRAPSDVLIYEGTITTAPVHYRYTIPARTALQVDVLPGEGSDLDPTVTVTDVRSGEVLAEDDDGAGNLGSRVRIVSERGQQVEIVVSPFGFLEDGETAGSYTLQLRPRPWAPPVTRAVTQGSDTAGTLEVGGSGLYTFQGTAGQLLEVAMVAQGEESALDSYLRIYQGLGTEGEVLQENDDGGNSLNSLLRVTLPADGIYTIEASPYGDTSGAYTLRVAAARNAVVSDGDQLGFGTPLGGFAMSVSDRVAQEEEGTGGALYRLSAAAIGAIRAGQGEVTFNLTQPLSEDPDFPGGIDPYLELGFETPLGFAAMKTDDDSGGDLNSRIPVDLAPLAADGDWLERLRLRATSIGEAGGFAIDMAAGLQDVVETDYALEAAAAVDAAFDAATEAVEGDVID